MAVSINTTIQNRAKAERLANSYVIPKHHLASSQALHYLNGITPAHYPREEDRHALLYSVGMTLLNGSISEVAEKVLKEYETDLVLVGDVPDCPDILGSIYQYLNTKQENLLKGSFYTGPQIADDLVSNLDFDSGQRLIDPSCGSGMFLFRSDGAPEQLFGIDRDPLAIMIAKFNYFLKFPDGPPPSLVCADFFDWYAEGSGEKFDYLIANPPYGANAELPSNVRAKVTSGETFSYFIEFGMDLLKPSGVARFLVPDALLNVKRHTDIRRFLLDNVDLRKVKKYRSRFTGLMSDVHQIEVAHGETRIVVMEGEATSTMDRSFINSLKNSIFAYLTDDDVRLIKHCEDVATGRLAGCDFGLGVVTGNNGLWLSDTPKPGMEPIYSGKEVAPYRFREPSKWIKFEREKLQQVAPDEIYRAPVKLVYKTISRAPLVAIDRTAALTTNSANIIVPQDSKTMSPESLAAILNSSCTSFLYMKMFGGVNKIGKEHLLALPIPAVTEEENQWLTNHVESLASDDDYEAIDRYVALRLFRLETSDFDYVKGAVGS